MKMKRNFIRLLMESTTDQEIWGIRKYQSAMKFGIFLNNIKSKNSTGNNIFGNTQD